MTEDQLFSMLGRLYAMTQMKDNEIRSLNTQIEMYQASIRQSQANEVLGDDEDEEES